MQTGLPGPCRYQSSKIARLKGNRCSTQGSSLSRPRIARGFEKFNRQPWQVIGAASSVWTAITWGQACPSAWTEGSSEFRWGQRRAGGGVIAG